MIVLRVGISSLVVLLGACAAPPADAPRHDSAAKSTAVVDSMLRRITEIDGVPTDTVAGDWTITQSKSEMDDGIVTVLILRSDHPFDAEPKYLAIRCERSRTDVLFHTGTSVETVTGGTLVRYRFDDEKAVSARWIDVEKLHAIVPPKPWPMIRAMAAAKRWRIEYSPYGRPSATVGFRPAGLNAALAKVGTACGR